MNWAILRRKIQKYMKKCSIPLAIKESKLPWESISSKSDGQSKENSNNKCWRGGGEKEPSHTVGGNVN
jgi:hypothetical protein